MQRRSVRSLMKTNSCPCPHYGRSMLKVSNSPYWKRPQYKALTAGKWDIIIIMLGTSASLLFSFSPKFRQFAEPF